MKFAGWDARSLQYAHVDRRKLPISAGWSRYWTCLLGLEA